MENIFQGIPRIQLKTPLTRDDVKSLTVGDVVELTGTIYTARDAAHKRLQDALAAGKAPPVDMRGQLIFYAGPCPAKPGRVIGSIAATTSMRMDVFTEMIFGQLGALGTIGKGDRGAQAAEGCKKYGGIYLLSIGGAAALISKQVKKCTVAAYDDLGTESIKRLEVEGLRLIVGIDTAGRVFQAEQIAKYRKN
ncbi:MAG: FumA C-terminus/TtdB family hydratase beta subunit [Spirochaetaceae bacterium]|jgi:fumarate hydratase subunit beta|nr:FumA C-terminus/TtdB family hydratase beta subunit [Spirochaetaceae bacterium]